MLFDTFLTTCFPEQNDPVLADAPSRPKVPRHRIHVKGEI
jgi:hypothetical protein